LNIAELARHIDSLLEDDTDTGISTVSGKFLHPRVQPPIKKDFEELDKEAQSALS